MANKIVLDDTIQEFFEFLKSRFTKVGDLAGLKTTAKDSIVNAINEIGGIADILTYNSIQARNALYRGKNLGTTITEEQFAAITANTFDDMHLGDYWIIGGKTAHIYDFQPKRILLLVSSFSGYSWNDTNTNAGGVLGSKMYSEHLPEMLAWLEQYIDPSYFASFVVFASDAMASTYTVSHWTSVSTKIWLPSYYNLRGIHIPNEYSFYGDLWWHGMRLTQFTSTLKLNEVCNAGAVPCFWEMFSGKPNARPASDTYPSAWPYVIIGQ